jgi:hypothetical protein
MVSTNVHLFCLLVSLSFLAFVLVSVYLSDFLSGGYNFLIGVPIFVV